MALDISRLANALNLALQVAYTADYSGTQEANPDYFISQLALAISTCVINEITGHAQCSGLDSHSDTHDNVGIV